LQFKIAAHRLLSYARKSGKLVYCKVGSEVSIYGREEDFHNLKHVVLSLE